MTDISKPLSLSKRFDAKETLKGKIVDQNIISADSLDLVGKGHFCTESEHYTVTIVETTHS